MRRNVAAVIVTYNRLEKLKEALEKSLEEPFFAVVVVNNKSTDGTAEWLDQHTNERLHVVHSPENVGGAGGFHQGFDFAAQKLPEAEWLVCYDDDAYPEQGMLREFDGLEVPDEVAGLAAAVYLPNGRVSEMNRPSVNAFWHLKELVRTSFRGRNRFYMSDAKYESKGPIEIDSSSFVGFFVRLSLIRERRLGLPRSELFIYFDDVIYALELRKAGFKHWFVPRLRFVHDCKSLVEQIDVYHPLWRVYYMYRNRQEMYRIASGKLYPLVALLEIPKLFLAVRFYQPFERKRYLRITIEAVRDGLLKNYSKSFSDVMRLSETPQRKGNNNS